MALNASNFLMWFSAGSTQFDTELPRPFVREPEVFSPVIWLVPGETYSTWINTTDNAAMTEKLEIVNLNGAAYDVPTDGYKTVTWYNGAHRLITFTVPVLPEGFWQLQLGTRRTQMLFLTNPDYANQYSAIVKFRDNGRVLDYRWAHAPADFYQQYRVRMAVRSIDPADEKKTYTGSTTGKTKHLFSKPRKMVSIVTAEYDQWGHDAWRAMMEHDTLLINGKPYAYGSAYRYNMSQGEALSDGDCSLSDETYASLHRS